MSSFKRWKNVILGMLLEQYLNAACVDKISSDASFSVEQVVETTAWLHQILGQILSSHLIVSSSRTVRLCGLGRWIGRWRTTWSTVCSFAPHSQAAEEVMPYLYNQVWRRLSWTQALLGRVMLGGRCQCWRWKYEVLWDCLCPLSIPLVIRATAPDVCHCQIKWWDVVQQVQMGISIWGIMHLHLMGGWALSGADIQVDTMACSRQCGSNATKLNKLDACEGWKVVRWCRTQAFSHNSPGVDEAGMSTVAPNRRAVLCSWMDQGWGGCSQRCCSNTPARASKPPQECYAWCLLLAKRLKVSVVREWPVHCYFEVFGLGAEGQGFVVEVDFQLTFGFLVVEVEDCRHRFRAA